MNVENLLGQPIRLTRLFLIGVLFAFMSTFPLIVLLIRYRKTTNTHWWCSITCPIATKILGLQIDIDRSALPDPNEAAVNIANHQAALDIITCGQLVPKRVAVLAAKWLGIIPFFGQVFYLAGNIVINRKNKQSKQGGVDQLHKALKKDHTSIWIFPEGTRSRGKGLGKFRPGAFRCAINNGVPIHAYAVSTYKGKIDFKKWASGKILVQALAPIPTLHLKEDDWLALMESTHAALKEKIAQLDLQLDPR